MLYYWGELQPGVCDNLERWDGVGGRFKRDGTNVYLRLIHVDVWQKPNQHCKAIILPSKINKSKKEKGLVQSIPAPPLC